MREPCSIPLPPELPNFREGSFSRGELFARGGGAGTHKLSACVAKKGELFPRGTERVAGGGAKRHHRNAVPKTAHPAEGWQSIRSPGGLWHALPGCRPGWAAFRGCRFARPPATFWDASGIGPSPPHAGSSSFFRCVSPVRPPPPRTPKFQGGIIFARRRGGRGELFENDGAPRRCVSLLAVSPLGLRFSGSTRKRKFQRNH
jgi:hypothetical protein